MKFTINRIQFAAALAKVASGVCSKAKIPILGHILIAAKDGAVTLTSTDLDRRFRLSVRAEVAEAGSTTLPGKKFAAVIKALSGPTVILDTGTNHQVKIAAGQTICRLAGISADEFPPIPAIADAKTFTMRQAKLKALLKAVAFAQSKDAARHILNGVLLKFGEGKLQVVGTDGRRLAFAERVAPANLSAFLIVPKATVAKVVASLGDSGSVTLLFNAKQVSFAVETTDKMDGTAGETEIYSKLVDGNYPNFQQVIPKDINQRVALPRLSFLAAVKRLSFFCTKASRVIKVSLAQGALELSCKSGDYGEATESLPVEHAGPKVEVCFNSAFLADTLAAHTDDEFHLEIKDDVSPGVLKFLNGLAVVMPVRVT